MDFPLSSITTPILFGRKTSTGDVVLGKLPCLMCSAAKVMHRTKKPTKKTKRIIFWHHTCLNKYACFAVV